MLPLDGLGLSCAEVAPTRFALIAWDGLMVVLGSSVALLAKKARRWRQVIDAGDVGTDGPWVLHLRLERRPGGQMSSANIEQGNKYWIVYADGWLNGGICGGFEVL